MESSTTKKVLVRRFDRESIPGFVNPHAYLDAEGIELLLVSGIMQRIPYGEIKNVAFVKDFDPPKGHAEQKAFQSRPKIEGLWVAMQFRDGDRYEALLPNDLAGLEDTGFTVTPPNSTGNIQRMFVPKAALDGMTVLAVVGARSARKRTEPKKDQIELFGENE